MQRLLLQMGRKELHSALQSREWRPILGGEAKPNPVGRQGKAGFGSMPAPVLACFDAISPARPTISGEPVTGVAVHASQSIRNAPLH